MHCRHRALILSPILTILVLLQGISSGAVNLITNGDFTGSVSSWTSAGTVFNTGDAAVFSDSVATPVSLFQSTAVPSGFTGFSLSFDYFNGLSPTALDGFVPDTFFATLYLGATPFGTTLANGSYDEAVPLFDLDAGGAFNLPAGAILDASAKGAGWTRYTLHRATVPEPGFITLAFEFFNLNGSNSDSAAAIDNVVLTQIVPEPSRCCLLMAGLAAMCLRRRRAHSPP